MIPKLICCVGGNRRFAEIALDAGFLYGAQLPSTIYFPLFFADQNWKRPQRVAYMVALARWRPAMAVMVDWEREQYLPEVLSWAEEAAQYVEQIVIVPKVIGGIGKLPRRVAQCEVVLGYSVPTKYGGTELPLWEFAGWPVHLLGGSPQKQMMAWAHLMPIAKVISTDGNTHSLMATRHCRFWVPGTAQYASNRWWPSLTEADGKVWPNDAPYEAFRRSCKNIVLAWNVLWERVRGTGRGVAL